MSERTFDDFDDYAKDYRAVHTENVKLSGADSFYFAAMKVQLLQQFEKNSTLKILDIGCGDGATELFMQQYFPQWLVEGIDVSEKSIAEAKAKNIINSRFSVYNGTQIPFEDNSFDTVFIAGVLHHVDFDLHPIIMQEIFRVLKPGGRLYLFEHNPLNPVTKHLVNTCVFDKDAKLLRNNYTKRLIKKSGLTIGHNKFIIFFPRKGLLSKFIFLEKYLQWLPLGGQYFIRACK
ncbi:class I SAM-dependent methyltransferase [Ferruginibacter sp. SUN106]|uniref:class I SAM-dependent methyltransferase n=1 Tax=Ferruginibacter sp. SUN106 TaxID=2978348 RepID=UPI003D35E448